LSHLAAYSKSKILTIYIYIYIISNTWPLYSISISWLRAFLDNRNFLLSSILILSYFVIVTKAADGRQWNCRQSSRRKKGTKTLFVPGKILPLKVNAARNVDFSRFLLLRLMPKGKWSFIADREEARLNFHVPII